MMRVSFLRRFFAVRPRRRRSPSSGGNGPGWAGQQTRRGALLTPAVNPDPSSMSMSIPPGFGPGDRDPGISYLRIKDRSIQGIFGLFCQYKQSIRMRLTSSFSCRIRYAGFKGRESRAPAPERGVRVYFLTVVATSEWLTKRKRRACDCACHSSAVTRVPSMNFIRRERVIGGTTCDERRPGFCC
jgi:hypothetical protein